ncbi:MAG: tetratricopeptide repeat protein [Anaerolineae bacterium]
MEKYFDLGEYSRPISTQSAEAQIWFDRGLNWSYAFHHTEAINCFQKVIDLDPTCPMGYWGMAYAIGPYYNLMWPSYSEVGQLEGIKQAYDYTRTALEHCENATPAEKGLIQAFTARFPTPLAPQTTDKEEAEKIFSQWDDAYTQAMREVYAQFPNDNDVCALTAEAMMCRTPWKLWDLENGVPAEGTDTREALDIIEKAFTRIENDGTAPHPGLLHFYIHAQEMSPDPSVALKASDTLINLAPDAGHLIHMPSHIYVLCGQYERSLQANIEASAADERYSAYDDTVSIFALYKLHNLHFQIYSALFQGRYAPALRVAEMMEKMIPEEGLSHDHQFLVNYLEAFSGMKVHVYIRFGKWQEIIDAPLPPDPDFYCVTTAMWHYAKGVAYSATGDIPNAVDQKEKFAVALTKVPEERKIFNNTSLDILAVAGAMLEGELEYRRENYDVAYDHLRRTVALYDNLNYTEPWAWMQPPRHALGALLLEQGHVTEAAAVYRADLGVDDTLMRPAQHPNNIWSLHGYAECLEKLGQDEEAADVRAQLNIAQASADVVVSSSCFCRQTHSCCD